MRTTLWQVTASPSKAHPPPLSCMMAPSRPKLEVSIRGHSRCTRTHGRCEGMHSRILPGDGIICYHGMTWRGSGAAAGRGMVPRSKALASSDDYTGVPRKLARSFKFKVHLQLLKGLQDSPELIENLEAFVAIQPDIVSMSFLEYVRDELHTHSQGSVEYFQLEQLLSNLRGLAVKLEQESAAVDRELSTAQREEQLWQRQTELYEREVIRWNEERKAWERREAMLLGEIHRLQDALRNAYITVGTSNLETHEAQAQAQPNASQPADFTPFAQMMNSALATAAASGPVTDFTSKSQGTIAPTGNPRPETTYHPSGVFPPQFSPATLPSLSTAAASSGPSTTDAPDELATAANSVFAAMAAAQKVDVMDDNALSKFLDTHADYLSQQSKQAVEEDVRTSVADEEPLSRLPDMRSTTDYDALKKMLDEYGNVFPDKGESAAGEGGGDETVVDAARPPTPVLHAGAGQSLGPEGPVGPLEVTKASQDGPPPVLVVGDDDIFWVAHLHQAMLQLGYYPTDDDVQDYYFGDSTAEALKFFQSSASLPESGVADEGTWRALSVQTGMSFPGLLVHANTPDDPPNGSNSNPAIKDDDTPVEAAPSAEVASEPAVKPEAQTSSATSKVKWPVLVETDGGRAVHALQVLLRKAGYFCGEDEMRWWMFGDMTVNAVKTFQACAGLPETGVCDKRTWQALLGKDANPSMLESVKGEDEYEEDMTVQNEGRVYLIGEDRWAKQLPEKEQE